MAKIYGYKCDNCNKEYTATHEIFGIKMEHSIFETNWIFESKQIELCPIHVCQSCVKINIDDPIAYLKGRDREQWQTKRGELSKLMRFRLAKEYEARNVKKSK